jgi:crossover junction endodeoxyribonuclease RuvC
VIVLGIDPGTASLGYGIVERVGGTVRALDFGVFSTTPADPLPVRLDAIHQAVADLIATHRPALVAVERLFFSRNAQTAFAVGQARGVVLLAAAQAGIEVREATPNEVKSAVTGYGAADKEQVARMVAVVCGLPKPPTPDDAADALATAICIAHADGLVGQTVSATGAPLLDRASLRPLARGESGYERAVREALAREGTTARRATRKAS